MGGLELNRKEAGIWPSSLSLCLILCPSLCHWVVGGHHVPSSQTLICIISLWRGCINNALFPTQTHTHLETYREHWVQPTGSEVKSIVYVCVRIHVACLVNLLPYYASCYFRSVLECSLCMPTCANEALSTCALSKERWNFSSQQYGLEDSGMNILNFSHSAALERKEKNNKNTVRTRQ